MSDRIRFDAFELDEQSGELRRDDAEIARLSPQPARLLSHLVRSHPTLVTRDEIRQLLWPDVEVDFEQSLHTCVRQIRSALGDSASEPRYIETIPRRGYRFIGTPHAAPATRSMTPRRLAIAGGIGLVILLVVASLRFGAAPSIVPVRIAVMPFEPISPTSVLTPDNDIAESIVRLLATRRPKTTAIIGPTTTASYAGGDVRRMVAELDLDYVVNARETMGDAGDRLLIEVIRGHDGAHVWVRYLDDFPAGSDVAGIVAEATLQEAP